MTVQESISEVPTPESLIGKRGKEKAIPEISWYTQRQVKFVGNKYFLRYGGNPTSNNSLGTLSSLDVAKQHGMLLTTS